MKKFYSILIFVLFLIGFPIRHIYSQPPDPGIGDAELVLENQSTYGAGTGSM